MCTRLIRLWRRKQWAETGCDSWCRWGKEHTAVSTYTSPDHLCSTGTLCIELEGGLRVECKVTGKDVLSHMRTVSHNASCAGAIGWMWDVTELGGSMFPKTTLFQVGALLTCRNCSGKTVMRNKIEWTSGYNWQHTQFNRTETQKNITINLLLTWSFGSFFFSRHVLTFEITEAVVEATTVFCILRKKSGAFHLVKCNPDLLIGVFNDSHFAYSNAVCGCVKNSENVLCLKVVCFFKCFCLICILGVFEDSIFKTDLLHRSKYILASLLLI